jgi:eukaryotic-like serine/threonine-protein kinase
VHVVDARDRVEPEAFEQREAKDVAVLGRELGERLVHGALVGVAVLRDDLRELGIAVRCGELEERIVFRGRRVADPRAPRVEGRAHDHGAEPRPERAAPPVVEDLRRGPDEELLADRLEDLVGEVGAGAEGRERRDHLTAVRRIEMRERRRLARGAGAREHEVGHLDVRVARGLRPPRHVRFEDLVGERHGRQRTAGQGDLGAKRVFSHLPKRSVFWSAVDHLDENAILELLEHRMGEAERAAVETHLDACPACLELLAMMAAASPAPLALQPTELDVTRHLIASKLVPGHRLADRFVLERVVGEGGMGVVWAARDERAGGAGAVALKILKEVSAAERKRFLREAAVMQSFDHPGILDVREVVAVGDDVVLVMDLLEGESLGAHLGRVGRLPVAEASAVLVPLVEATLALHKRGVVHRDLKSENVYLCADGRVLVLDFGMAKLTASFDLAVSGWMTESGLLLGTPHYMAPEQIYGEPDVDARADVWALGVVVYECLSGERPISGKSFGQIARALQRREMVDLAVRAPSLPEELLALVRRMLAHDREARPSLAEVRDVLLALSQPAS